METHLRSLAKAISWRVVATLVTTIVVWILTGKLSLGILAGLTDGLAKIGLYWAHERGWQYIHWGRQVPPTSSP